MLQLNYQFLDPADNQTALDTIHKFLNTFTTNGFRTEIFNGKVMVFVYDLTCAYDAMQLINAIDVIIEPLGFAWTLDFIHYSEYTQKK